MARQWLMGLDIGGGKGRCVLVDADNGRTVSTFRAWRHRPVADWGAFSYDLDTVLVWKLLGEAAREARARRSIAQ